MEFMDAAFTPTEVAVRLSHTVAHTVNHKFTLDFGPSITDFNWKPVRNLLILALAVKGPFDIVKALIDWRVSLSSANSQHATTRR